MERTCSGAQGKGLVLLHGPIAFLPLSLCFFRIALPLPSGFADI